MLLHLVLLYTYVCLFFGVVCVFVVCVMGCVCASPVRRVIVICVMYACVVACDVC